MSSIPKHLTMQLSTSSISSLESDGDSDEPLEVTEPEPFLQLDSDTASVLNEPCEATTHKVRRETVI